MTQEIVLTYDYLSFLFVIKLMKLVKKLDIFINSLTRTLKKAVKNCKINYK